MQNKKLFFILVIFVALFIFCLATQSTYAMGCGDPYPAGNCEFGSCPSGTRQIADSSPSPYCSDGQVCCETDPVKPADTPAGGCCVLDKQGYCFNVDGTTCSSGKFYSSSCSQLSACVMDTSTSGASPIDSGSRSVFPTDSGSSSPTAIGGGWSLGSIAGYGLPSGTMGAIIMNIMFWILGIFGALGILGFIISGIIYLTSAGNEDRMGAAKRAMLYSIIGVIVGLVGFVIIQAIDMALNAFSSF